VKTIGSLNFSEKNWNWRFLDYGNLEGKKKQNQLFFDSVISLKNGVEGY
jgi:hypothetical protein